MTLATRMDTSVEHVHGKHTYIYKYLFPLDIYKYIRLGVRETYALCF